MGALGPALFSDDVACDVRGHYHELLEDGAGDAEALSQTLERYAEPLADKDDEPIVILALAVTASKLGRLTPELRDRAISLLDAGRGAERWEEDPKLLSRRIAALGNVRAQLAGEQPARKKVRPLSRHVTSLEPGDLLAIELRDHDFMAVRVVRLEDTRYHVAPTIQVLDWRGNHLPTVAELRVAPDLAPRPPTKGATTNPWWSTRGTKLGRRGHDYHDVGFVEIGTIEPRPGDAESVSTSSGAWESLARQLRVWTEAD